LDAGRDARELLLNSATELFAIHGVAATSFAMIAKRAGLTPAMVHYYFKDRNQLCDAVVNERLLRIASYVWDAVEPDADPAETIRGIIERLFDRIEVMPWIPSLWIREILHEGGLLREGMLSRVPFKGAQKLAGAIAKGQINGSLNPEVEPLLVITSTLGMVMLNIAATRILAQALHRKPPDMRAVQRHITGLLLHGVCHKPPSRSNPVSRTKKR
jgi:AcrR family transcriptional regulator